ncbi:TetR/AcrR family transcriptional regulator [Streptomyces sp. NBC_01515]|uniref:TetR/AcrR family transcriptional regulator n=1 Tax=Streptomyces sp. NBC_01515 TaxID=2903890 RepID=UPI00386A4E65
MSSTRTRLLNEATRIVRRRGYTGFSYADLAGAVEIRKPSIHHHFPTKADLGLEMVIAYTAAFLSRLWAAEKSGAGAVELLEFYAGLYREGLSEGLACLCGTLAAESEAVPVEVRGAVAGFFAANFDWLTRQIEQGAAAGELSAAADPRRAGQGFLALLQGAVFTARALDDPSLFDAVAASAIEGLRT